MKLNRIETKEWLNDLFEEHAPTMKKRAKAAIVAGIFEELSYRDLFDDDDGMFGDDDESDLGDLTLDDLEDAEISPVWED